VGGPFPRLPSTPFFLIVKPASLCYPRTPSRIHTLPPLPSLVRILLEGHSKVSLYSPSSFGLFRPCGLCPFCLRRLLQRLDPQNTIEIAPPETVLYAYPVLVLRILSLSRPSQTRFHLVAYRIPGSSPPLIISSLTFFSFLYLSVVLTRFPSHLSVDPWRPFWLSHLTTDSPLS